MAEPALSPQLQKDLADLQSLNAQLASAQQQRAQFEALKAESQQALEALEALPEGAAVYRNVGSLLVRDAGPKEAAARLKEDLETLEVRLGRLQKQEEAVRASATALQRRIQAALPKA